MPVSKQHRTHFFYNTRTQKNDTEWPWYIGTLVHGAMEMKWNDVGHKCKINFKQSDCSKFRPEVKMYCCSPLFDWIRAARNDFRFGTEQKYALNPKYIQLCIHRWWWWRYYGLHCDCYTYLLQYIEKWAFLVSSDTTPLWKITETTELFFSFIFSAAFASSSFLLTSHQDLRFFVQKYCASCVRGYQRNLAYLFLIFHTREFFILFGHRYSHC